MPIDSYRPVDHIVLRSTEAISAYAHPIRMAILAVLAQQESTLSMIAEKLGTSAANLYHHVRKLLGARLIMLVETRATAKNVEKYYRASAYSYSIDFGDKTVFDQSHDNTARKKEFAAVLENLNASSNGNTFARLTSARISEDQAVEFRATLEGLLQNFTAKDGEGGEAYSLGIAFFPNP